ncbi:Crp/Fnr family transcriptional regulator, partial [Thermodesulfobacteriota bacterium]
RLGKKTIYGWALTKKDETMPVDAQILQPLDFFKDMTQSELEEFATLLNARTVKKGDIIIREGTSALTFFVILSGSFEVSFEKGRSITIDKIGEIMGWSTIVYPFHYTGTVTTMTDGDVLSISSRDFFQLIQANNVLGEKIMKKINKIAMERRAHFSDAE